jgi:hypothetical protein
VVLDGGACSVDLIGCRISGLNTSEGEILIYLLSVPTFRNTLLQIGTAEFKFSWQARKPIAHLLWLKIFAANKHTLTTC